MKIFYHTDMDGKCAGAIVYHYFKNKPKQMIEEIECIPINYNHNFPFDKITPDELIYIVDFSLQKEDEFEALLEITQKVVWIDHHKTAIEKHKNIADRVSGIRNDLKAGCELTWNFLYPNVVTPYIVKLLADYDLWIFEFGSMTNELQTGIRLHSNNPEDNNWIDWLGPDSKTFAHKLCEEGKPCIKYRNNYYAGLIKAWSFPIEFEGYNCIACNAGSVSSQLFDSVKEDYDIMLPFIFDGSQWTISLYTKKDIDVSEIAKKYGGGGHKKAAGFQCQNLPWRIK